MPLRVKNLLSKFKNFQLLPWTPSLSAITQSIDTERTILSQEQWTDAELLTLAAEGEFHSFINTNHPHFHEDLEAMLKVQSDPKAYLTNPIPALFAKTPNTLFLLFNKKEDKPHLIHFLDQFLKQTKSKAIETNARLLFEELFMNAIYDAPMEAKKLNMAKKSQHNELYVAFDTNKFMISCFDPYGSLNVEKLLNRMRDIVAYGTKDMINMNQQKGGAGIGCSLLFRYSSGLIITVEPGMGTRVTCLLPLRMSQKQFSILGKNLQAFTITKGQDNE